MPRREEPNSAHELAGLLAEALQHIHAAGDSDTACRIAAKAWTILRSQFPKDAYKMEALLHRFTGVLHRG